MVNLYLYLCFVQLMKTNFTILDFLLCKAACNSSWSANIPELYCSLICLFHTCRGCNSSRPYGEILAMITMKIVIQITACITNGYENVEYVLLAQRRVLSALVLSLAIAAGNSSWGEYESGFSLQVSLPFLLQHSQPHNISSPNLGDLSPSLPSLSKYSSEMNISVLNICCQYIEEQVVWAFLNL